MRTRYNIRAPQPDRPVIATGTAHHVRARRLHSHSHTHSIASCHQFDVALAIPTSVVMSLSVCLNQTLAAAGKVNQQRHIAGKRHFCHHYRMRRTQLIVYLYNPPLPVLRVVIRHSSIPPTHLPTLSLAGKAYTRTNSCAAHDPSPTSPTLSASVPITCTHTHTHTRQEQVRSQPQLLNLLTPTHCMRRGCWPTPPGTSSHSPAGGPLTAHTIVPQRQAVITQPVGSHTQPPACGVRQVQTAAPPRTPLCHHAVHRCTPSKPDAPLLNAQMLPSARSWPVVWRRAAAAASARQ